jgi:hypothetical protein
MSGEEAGHAGEECELELRQAIRVSTRMVGSHGYQPAQRPEGVAYKGLETAVGGERAERAGHEWVSGSRAAGCTLGKVGIDLDSEAL